MRAFPHCRRPVSLTAFAFAFVFVASCGGGDTVAPTTPEKPTTPTTPTTPTPTIIVVQAGDNQVADPGATLTIKPVVVVKDAGGAGVSGISVTFSVDSGGGRLQATSATTASDGTASPGDWTLGSTEGRNIVTARTGSLTPVKLVATSRVATVTTPVGTVTSSGGTLTLSQPGSPLNGTTLTMPAGAVSSSGSVSFMVSSSATIALPQGATALTPALTITGPLGTFAQPASLRVPVMIPSGAMAMVIAINSATGAKTVLPTIERSASTVTVGLESFDGSTFVGGTPSSGAPGAMLSATPAQAFSSHASVTFANEPVIVVIAIDPALLAGDFDSGFRAGVDDWDFQRQAVSRYPEGTEEKPVDPAETMVATSIWYYANMKSTVGKLYERYQEAKGIGESNRRGLRWTSVASNGRPDLWSPGGIAQKAAQARQADPNGATTQGFNELKAAFLLSSNKPQPVFLYTTTNTVVDTEPRFGIATKTVGKSIELVIPDAPGTSFTMSIVDGSWTPINVTTRAGVVYRVTFVMPVQYGIIVQDARFSEQFARVANGTIGNAEGWPAKPTLHSKWGVHDTAGVILLDTLHHWWECDGCADHGYRNPKLDADPPPTRAVAFRLASKSDDGTWTALGTKDFGGMNFSRFGILATRATATGGFALYQPWKGSMANAQAALPAWLDWSTVLYKKLDADVTPDTIITTRDTTINFSLSVPGVPSGSQYRWSFYGKTADSTVTSNATFAKQIRSAQRTRMYATALEKDTKRPIARDSTEVFYGRAWQFESTSLASVQLPPGGIGSEDTDTLVLQFVTNSIENMRTTPSNSQIWVYTAPTNCQALVLQQFGTGSANDTGYVAQAFRAILGNNCIDPDFQQSLTMGPIGRGTITGSVVDVNTNPDQIVVPGGSITATMSGKRLTGTFVWRVRYSTGIATYTVNFVAFLSPS